MLTWLSAKLLHSPERDAISPCVGLLIKVRSRSDRFNGRCVYVVLHGCCCVWFSAELSRVNSLLRSSQ